MTLKFVKLLLVIDTSVLYDKKTSINNTINLPYCSFCCYIFPQLDGYIARNFKGQKSTLGTVLDPLADKVLMTVLTVTLSMAHLLPGKLLNQLFFRKCKFKSLVSKKIEQNRQFLVTCTHIFCHKNVVHLYNQTHVA